MLTHDHPDFPSDIFTILEGVGARLVIGMSTSDSFYSTVEPPLSGLGGTWVNSPDNRESG